MRDCERVNLRDNLPELLNERLAEAERADVLAHLGECPDCDAELTLLRAARASIVGSAPAVDSAAIARAVSMRLAARSTPTLRLLDASDSLTPVARQVRPASRSRSWRPLRAAAAIVVVALGAGGVFVARGGDGASPRTAKRSPTAVALGAPLDTNTGSAHVRVPGSPRQSLTMPAGSSNALHRSRVVASADVDPPASALGSTFAELSDDELAAVIQAVDAAGGLPASEPLPTPDLITPGGTRGGAP